WNSHRTLQPYICSPMNKSNPKSTERSNTSGSCGRLWISDVNKHTCQHHHQHQHHLFSLLSIHSRNNLSLCSRSSLNRSFNRRRCSQKQCM
ncbi:hypothetical protein HDU81_001628, partial [Chytriomyces hyalinus]